MTSPTATCDCCSVLLPHDHNEEYHIGENPLCEHCFLYMMEEAGAEEEDETEDETDEDEETEDAEEP